MPGRWRTLLLDSPSARFNHANNLLTVALLLCAYLQQVSDTRWAESLKQQAAPALIDTVHGGLPLSAVSVTIANLFLLIGLVVTVVGLLFIIPTWPRRILALQRVFWVLGLLLLLRAAAISFTVPTSPRGPLCVASTTTGLSFAQVLGNTFLVLFGINVPCTATIPSNNAIMLTTFLIQWLVYCHDLRILIFASLFWATGCVLAVVARIDYSVSVILGSVLTWLAFGLYFALQAAEARRWQDRVEAARQGASSHECHKERTTDAAGASDDLACTPVVLHMRLARAIGWMDGVDLRGNAALGSIDLGSIEPTRRRTESSSFVDGATVVWVTEASSS